MRSFYLFSFIDEEEETKEVENPRGNLKRKHSNHQKDKKKNEGVPVNFFFDTDLTDSENESMDIDEGQGASHRLG